ncbi:MAG: hypothetical protein F6K40_12515 [Okeania sp. SIO3I5]|uniref:hypothetical protein n=1 Tax=Okeania sp. SIO3I5 TaxID=2607805 RepID=UPI0013B9E056|nr:hypothetical protein [Okeania sp. SIO3I5]NEQ37053.1 hypothetical protein [Okeania sp. SIO3I5]
MDKKTELYKDGYKKVYQPNQNLSRPVMDIFSWIGVAIALVVSQAIACFIDANINSIFGV